MHPDPEPEAPYVLQARLRKAARLARVLREAGCDDPRILSGEDRSLAERTAGVRPASDHTWQLVRIMLAAWPTTTSKEDHR